MYTHILLPTDGSALARNAALDGILLAKNIGARVSALYVIPVPQAERIDAWLHHDPDFAHHRDALLDRFAEESLTYVANSALAEQVPCRHLKLRAAEPWQAIVQEAERAHCDLIFMASRGWKTGADDLLGSQTLKVLRQSSVPVLVHKPLYVRAAERHA